MISLHIAKQLADQGFGTLDQDIFWEENPLDESGEPKDGVWVLSRGSAVDRFHVKTQAFDIYSRYTDKIQGSKKLEDILLYLQEAFGEVCELPEVPPYSNISYSNVRITPSSSVENVGTDENGKIVRLISGSVQYNRD